MLIALQWAGRYWIRPPKNKKLKKMEFPILKKLYSKKKVCRKKKTTHRIGKKLNYPPKKVLISIIYLKSK